VELAEAIHWDDGKGKREKKERGGGSVGIGVGNDDDGRPPRCGRMKRPSLTARRGHGRFSRPDAGDAKEDRGSDGDNGTPDNRGSGEERNDGSVLPATAVKV